MFTRLQMDSPEGVELNAEVKRILDYAGRIREFSVTVAEESRRLKAEDVAALDAAVAKLGVDSVEIYDVAKVAVQGQIKMYDEEIEAKVGTADGQLLALARKRLTSYVSLGFEEVRQQIVRHLDDQ